MDLITHTQAEVAFSINWADFPANFKLLVDLANMKVLTPSGQKTCARQKPCDLCKMTRQLALCQKAQLCAPEDASCGGDC